MFPRPTPHFKANSLNHYWTFLFIAANSPKLVAHYISPTLTTVIITPPSSSLQWATRARAAPRQPLPGGWLVLPTQLSLAHLKVRPFVFSVWTESNYKLYFFCYKQILNHVLTWNTAAWSSGSYLRNDSYFGAVHADWTCTRELANP